MNAARTPRSSALKAREAATAPARAAGKARQALIYSFLDVYRAEPMARELLALGEPLPEPPWLGARPCTADMLPVMGPAPRHPGLWFNFGHAHQGFTLGPVAGRLLAEMVAGERSWIDPAPYAPARFG